MDPRNKALHKIALAGPRSQSLHSTIAEDKRYESVDVAKLYESVLKIVLLEYINEARFITPKPAPSSEGITPSRSNAEVRKSRMSRIEQESQLPSYLLADLKAELNLIAMKKSSHDDLTRRSLLRFYGDMLDPRFAAEVKRVNSVDILVMKFVSTANKEVTKLGLVPADEISSVVFSQAEALIKIIIKLVLKDKNSEALVAKLNEHKKSLKPSLPPKPLPANNALINFNYSKPTFLITDMDQGYINLLKALFNVDVVTLQSDVNKMKSIVTQKTISKDLDQVLFYINKDIGKYAPDHFASRGAFDEWKQREIASCELLKARYKIPPPIKLLPLPSLPDGADFYVMPPTQLLLSYLVVLIKLSFLHHRRDAKFPLDTGDSMLFDNKTGDLIQSCARVWRIDYPTRSVSILTAAHISGILKDRLFSTDSKELGPIDIDTSISVFHTCKRAIEEGNLDWDDKHLWSKSDQEEWVKHLGYTYSDVFYSLKDSLSVVLSNTVKPKFAPYLQFLANYIESDALFPRLSELGVVTKWEKKLRRTLLRASQALYTELLASLPRDNTVSIAHILDIADKLIEKIKALQKKYKNPLLGFLYVGTEYATVVTGMFASDSENILKHITANIRKKGEFLNYADAIEAYKSLYEIRSIYQQVATEPKFKFNLEDFFYPYLEAWVSESGDKITKFVENALIEDSFEPIDIEVDSKKHSSSVHDIFSFIKQYLNILKALHWQNAYQLAKVHTALMKSICNCCLLYASEISDMVMKDLSEEVEVSSIATNEPEKNGWLAEVKSIVNNIQLGSQKLNEEPYNFKPRTCIGLNNLSSMIEQLAKLEQIIDPEQVSLIVAENDPSSKQYYKSHVFTIRIVRAEELRLNDSSKLRSYVTLIDTEARKTIARTRTVEFDNPEWDEEFELTIPAKTSATISATIWEEKFGSHAVCGRGLLQLEPRKFKHDGMPQEIFLDLDPQGRVHIEVAVESERDDAIFSMGRAHRALKRSQQRIIKLIVAKFSNFIKVCFSRQTLRSVCGNSGNLKPSQEQMDEAMLPLYNYLNMNLLVLAQYLTKDLLLLVMLEAWNVVVSCADELLLPKLTSAKAIKKSLVGFKGQNQSTGNIKSGWQNAVTAVASVTGSINYLGFGKTLTNNEIETVISWLNFLCFDFFHNEGNGPPLHDLKNDQYQSLLLIPVYYDHEVSFLKQEAERLSPAFLQTMRDKNNIYVANHPSSSAANLRSRAGSIARSLTIRANATAKARARAQKEAQQMLSDPLAAQTSAENIILRLLLIKDEKLLVARRMEQRERLAHTIATERLAKAAAEGRLFS